MMLCTGRDAYDAFYQPNATTLYGSAASNSRWVGASTLEV